MGESPKITDPLAALDAARAAFESGDDFTIGIEEEFAILEPAGLNMVAGFERIDAAARTGPLEDMVAGELIRSEVEVRTGRCESFAEAAETLARRRADLLGGVRAARLPPVGRRDAPVRALAGPGRHRHARITTWSNRRCATWPGATTPSASTSTPASAAPTGRSRWRCALRSVLPELLAASCSSPWLEGRHTHLHSTRTQIFTRFFPRCGIPDRFADWDDYAAFVRFLIATRSIREHTEIWWSVRPHQAFPTVEIRICDAQPEFDRAVALSGLMVALSAHYARSYDEGRPLPAHPRQAARGEPVAGHPVGHVRRADRPRRRPVDAGARAARGARRRGVRDRVGARHHAPPGPALRADCRRAATPPTWWRVREWTRCGRTPSSGRANRSWNGLP